MEFAKRDEIKFIFATVYMNRNETKSKYYILISVAVLLHSVTMNKAANCLFIIEDPIRDE